MALEVPKIWSYTTMMGTHVGLECSTFEINDFLAWDIFKKKVVKQLHCDSSMFFYWSNKRSRFPGHINLLRFRWKDFKAILTYQNLGENKGRVQINGQPPDPLPFFIVVWDSTYHEMDFNKRRKKIEKINICNFLLCSIFYKY